VNLRPRAGGRGTFLWSAAAVVLRSSTLSFVLFGALVVACAGVEASALDERGGGDGPESDDASAGRATAAQPDSSFAPIGSPLCQYHVDAGNETCLPDDDGRSCTSTRTSGAGDGGTPACRIVSSLPKCTDGRPEGVDGVACEKREDCAAGFDCIKSMQGGGVCRHYCCSGSCAGVASQNGGATFCDVQEIYTTGGKVPVCMPIKKCRLLTAGDCAAGDPGETCAIVTEKGDTGCVLIGEARAGAFCDEQHCAANLTCLGSPGNRRCYALCRIDRSTCTDGQKCTTGTVFSEQTYGVCK
jgi:hypothetical protein